MEKRVAITLTLIFSALVSGTCTTWTITNSGYAFTPDTITITYGDTVNFSLESIHNAVEVSQATWDGNGNTPLSSGFSLPLGGGTVTPDKLSVGTHWYVCSPHASLGMKGVIIVETATTAITAIQPQLNVSFYPNPVIDMITIRADEDLVGSPYSFTDLTGKQILTGKLDDETVSIDISSFETGIYLLQIGEQRRRTFKMIKR
jgi:plastocyanin